MGEVEASSGMQRGPRVRRLYAPPVFDDTETTASAGLTHWLALSLLVANLASLLTLMVVMPSQAERFLVLAAAVVAVNLAALLLNRRGSVVAADWLLIAGMWLIVLVAVWTAGGLANSVMAALVTLVILSGVLLGWRAGTGVAVGGIVTVLVLAYLEASGRLPAPGLVQTTSMRAVWIVDILVVSTVAMVVFARDLTGVRDRALQALADVSRSEEAMRAVMDNAPLGIHTYRLDEDDRLVFGGYNRKAAEVLSVDHDRLLGMTLEDAFPGNLGTDTPDAFRRVAREGGTYHLDHYAYDAEGIAGIFEIHAFNSGPRQVSVFFRDVTERRMEESALRDAHEMLAVAQRAASAGFWSWDMPSGELTWTPEFYALFGLPPDAEASFDTWRGALHPEDLAVAEARITESIEQRVALDNEYRILLPDGTVRWIGASGTTHYGDDGTPLRMSGICIDISEAKRREGEIVALNAELERRVEERTHELSMANRELQDFVYSASHDLRAPLRAMDGFSEILMEDCGDRLGQQDLAHLQRIRAASQHMAELIDALLALSRVGRRELDLRPVDLSAAAWTIVDELRESAPERHVSVAVADRLEARTDPALADIVLRNLIGNAWKFTSRTTDATIEVGAARKEGRLVFFVRDNGAGFDGQHARDMFRPFHRLHTQDEFPGTGIGLATVQRALDRLGGQCHAEGSPGEGATFSFTLG